MFYIICITKDIQAFSLDKLNCTEYTYQRFAKISKITVCIS